MALLAQLEHAVARRLYHDKVNNRHIDISSSSSCSVDQLDAGRRPLCPIHYVDPFLNQIKIKKKLTVNSTLLRLPVN